MVRQIIWLEEARDELAQVSNYIRQYSEQNAEKVVRALLASSRELADFPRLGPMVPEFGEEDSYRSRRAYSYRLVYRITAEEDIHILAVWHAARPLPQSVKRR